jgi:hypothetical protein
LPVAATMPARVSQGIINGELCDETVEPTAVALMFDGTVDFGQGGQDLRTVLCTGTLIAPDVVLLAAHCLDTSALTFGFGSTTREEWYVSFEADLARFAEQSEALPELPASAIPVADTAAHPDFDLQSLGQGVDGVENDIALVFLAAPVTTVVPEVVLTPAEASGLSVGATVRIAGWGQQTVTNGFFDPPPPGSVGIKICGSSTINEIGATLIQIGGDASTTRKCHGDSGGPTYFTLAGEQAIARRVIGVTSRAYDQEDCNKGGVDTRVDAFVDYLEDEMRTRCTAGTRTWCAVEGLLTADDVFALAHPEAGEGEGEDGDDDNNNDDGSDGEGARGPSGCAAAQPTDAVTAAAVVALLGRRRRRA